MSKAKRATTKKKPAQPATSVVKVPRANPWKRQRALLIVHESIKPPDLAAWLYEWAGAQGIEARIKQVNGRTTAWIGTHLRKREPALFRRDTLTAMREAGINADDIDEFVRLKRAASESKGLRIASQEEPALHGGMVEGVIERIMGGDAEESPDSIVDDVIQSTPL